MGLRPTDRNEERPRDGELLAKFGSFFRGAVLRVVTELRPKGALASSYSRNFQFMTLAEASDDSPLQPAARLAPRHTRRTGMS
jgi:hypothetical protein